MRRASMVGAAGAATLLFAACYPATAVRVDMGTDVACDDRTTTAVFVTEATTPASEVGAPVAIARACAFPAPSNIGSVVLVPRDAKDANMRVEAVLARNGKDPVACRDNLDDCVVARRIVAYRKHSTRALPIALSNQCLGVSCPDTETCVSGACVGADVDAPGFCAGADCDAGAPPPPPPPPPPPADAGTDDASTPPPACRGVLLADVARPSGPMRVSATHIYWLAPTGVKVLPKVGGASAKIVEGFTLFAPNDIHLFVGGPIGTKQLGLDGTGGTLTPIQAVAGVAAYGTRSVVAAGGSVYELPVSPMGSLSYLFARDVSRLAMSVDNIYVASPTSISVWPRKTPYAASLQLNVVNNTYIDVVAAPGLGAFSTDHAIYFARDTGILAEIVLPQKMLGGVALDLENIYYTERSGGTAEVVYRNRAAVGVGGTLASGFADATAIAADASCVYFWRLSSSAVNDVGEIVAVPRP
jgi:hypothetical protein